MSACLQQENLIGRQELLYNLQTQAPTLFNSTKRNPVVLHDHALSPVQDVLPNLVPGRCHVRT